MLFQGEEWGASAPFFYFTDYQEPELANAVREGRCKEFATFGWKPEDTADPQARETFEKSKLDWDEISKSPHAEILDWHKKLIRLRRSESDLSDGNLNCVCVNFDEENRWLILERGKISIACNFSNAAQAIPIRRKKNQIVLASETDINILNGAINLSADSVAIFKSEAV
jgi:maltooligosyltrehalose trehalohydrolase